MTTPLSISLPRIVGVVDEEPFEPRTWSKCSRSFFTALQRQDALLSAFSAEPSSLVRRLYQLRNFHPDLEKWKFKYHLDTGYFRAMSRTALEKLKLLPKNDFNTILQIGAWYDLSEFKGVIKTSYHDGNLSTLLASLKEYPHIKRKFIDRAMQYEQQLYRKMDLIFTMGEWLASSFINDFGLSSSKIFPVGAGINLPMVRDTSDKNYNNKTLLFVGGDFKRKGGYVLLDAFKKVRHEVPGVKLRIVSRHINDLPEGVENVGYIDTSTEDGLEHMLDEYYQATVFVMPSLYEPFGCVWAEAMAHRLPCVGTNICAMPEIISEKETGYVVQPNDSKALAKVLISLLESPDHCRQLGNNGYQKYLSNYTWDIVASKVIETIKVHSV